MDLPLLFLIVHGLIGGIDVVFNHELKERLPYAAFAKREEALHSLRELFFAILFFALAWYEWRGIFALGIIMLLALELLTTTIDSIVEDRTRQLSGFERVNHNLLFINSGIILVTLLPVLAAWTQMPTAIVQAAYGWKSDVLTVFAWLALAWSLRDLNRYRKLKSSAVLPSSRSYQA